MAFLKLLNNITLLISLVLIHTLIYKRYQEQSHIFKILSGILFGIITCIGMHNSYQFSNGVIFDGRTIILSLAPLFSGIQGSLLSLGITVGYRYYLGGTGAFTGMVVSVTATVLGILLVLLFQKKEKTRNLFSLIIFAYFVNLVMLFEFYITFPKEIAIVIVKTLTIPVISIYPLSTVLLFYSLSYQIQTIGYEKIIENSLKEKDLLIKELYHRTKNNMQIIISWLSLKSLQFEESELQNELKKIVNKIYSMAIVHQMLYSSQNFSRINLITYVNTLVEKIDLSYPDGQISFHKEIPNISISIDAAIPIGIILSELIANTYQHGYGQSNCGDVNIIFKFLGNDQILLTYEELNNMTFKNSGNTLQFGLGLTTIHNICKTQLNGTFQIDTEMFFKVEMCLNLQSNKIRI
ncbi:MAG: hypothetical protein H7A25_07495 [Leptospiraceae bacterium]|nr:hypothetical protein [Leptospiraceae bacterium]MCP5499729.1 hypothetical protein [Leptospiraceae bacterium]